jgi:hypothetical protein
VGCPRRFRAKTNVFNRSHILPNEQIIKKGKDSLQIANELIDPNMKKQKTGVASLLNLYSQLESLYDSVKGLGSSAALMWAGLLAHQKLRDHIVTLRDQLSDLLTTMDDFETKRSSMSIHLGANLLDPAIQSLISSCNKNCKDITESMLIQKLRPKIATLQMLQNSILMATGVKLDKKDTVESDKNDGDWEEI